MVEALVMYAVPTALVSLFMGVLYAFTSDELFPRRIIFLTLSLLSMSLTFSIIGEHGSFTSAAYQLMKGINWLLYFLIFWFVAVFFMWMMKRVRGGEADED